MRELTKKQKNLLIKWHEEKEPTKEGRMLFGKINELWKFEDLSIEQIEKLEKINDTEILSQNVTRFLCDLNIGAEK